MFGIFSLCCWEIFPLGAESASYSLRGGLGTWLALWQGKGPGDANVGQRVEAVWERFDSSPPIPYACT